MERIPKKVVAAVAVFVLLLAVWQAYRSPGYFTNDRYLVGLVGLEFLTVAVFFYRKIFFPLTLTSFLFAGLNVNVGSGWTTARWVFLGVGAAVGLVITLKDHICTFNRFHAFALFAAMAALVSSAVSPFPVIAIEKTASLFLLFAYAGAGVRIAVAGRENQFFSGLLLGCQLFVAAVFALHMRGTEAMGNPNSLGAVMGVALAPILLWGALLPGKTWERYTRIGAAGLCIYLVFLSRSRAGIAAAAISFALLTVGLKRYRLLTVGLSGMVMVIATLSIMQPDFFSNRVSSFTNEMVYKGATIDQGILASRQSTWNDALDSISKHLWFGTGFGTTDTGKDASAYFGQLASTFEITTEHGSSYLAITSWVGLVGVLPFVLLTLVVLSRAMRTIKWMLQTKNPMHPAVPLAMVVFAGLLHAGFEDWLFAPGYYLCVFFWSMAFILVDVTPHPAPMMSWNAGAARIPPTWQGMTPRPQ